MKKIILASASPRRSELLKQIGLNFEVMASNIEEPVYTGMTPSELVRRLSYDKAKHIAISQENGTIVIGADTIVVKDGILGKPVNRQEAVEMLTLLRGTWHEVYTGVSIIEAGTQRFLSESEGTRVKFRDLDENTIKAYIATGEGDDKAGAYGIQNIGAILVEKIEGCYFNVVGLPLSRTANMLKSFGIDVLNIGNGDKDDK